MKIKNIGIATGISILIMIKILYIYIYYYYIPNVIIIFKEENKKIKEIRKYADITDFINNYDNIKELIQKYKIAKTNYNNFKLSNKFFNRILKKTEILIKTLTEVVIEDIPNNINKIQDIDLNKIDNDTYKKIDIIVNLIFNFDSNNVIELNKLNKLKELLNYTKNFNITESKKNTINYILDHFIKNQSYITFWRENIFYYDFNKNEEYIKYIDHYINFLTIDSTILNSYKEINSYQYNFNSINSLIEKNNLIVSNNKIFNFNKSYNSIISLKDDFLVTFLTNIYKIKYLDISKIYEIKKISLKDFTEERGLFDTDLNQLSFSEILIELIDRIKNYFDLLKITVLQNININKLFWMKRNKNYKNIIIKFSSIATFSEETKIEEPLLTFKITETLIQVRFLYYNDKILYYKKNKEKLLNISDNFKTSKQIIYYFSFDKNNSLIKKINIQNINEDINFQYDHEKINNGFIEYLD